jgi:hypothetical protein
MIIVLSLVVGVKKIIYRLPHGFQPQPGLVFHKYSRNLDQSYQYFVKWIYRVLPTYKSRYLQLGEGRADKLFHLEQIL